MCPGERVTPVLSPSGTVPPRIHPGSRQPGRKAEPADTDTAVITGEEDPHAPPGNDEVNQDQGFGADDKSTGTGNSLKNPAM